MLGGGYAVAQKHEERKRKAEGLAVASRRDATAVVVDKFTAHSAVVCMGASRPTVLDSVDAANVRVVRVDGSRFRVHRGSAMYGGLPGIVPIACTCKDWEYRGTARDNVEAALGCKHMLAVEMYMIEK